MTGLVFSLRELSTNLKNTDFHFQNLGKPLDFVVKHYIKVLYIIIIIIFFFLRFTIFDIIFIFLFWSKSFKIIGCAKTSKIALDWLCRKYIFWYTFGYAGGWVIKDFSPGQFPETRLFFVFFDQLRIQVPSLIVKQRKT